MVGNDTQMGVLDKGIMSSLFTRKKPNDLYQSMMSTFNSPYAPKTQNYSQGLFSSQARTPQMSVAPKTVQGSGYSSQYASNPTNYKPPKPVPPPVTPPSTPTNQGFQRVDDFITRMTNQSNQRVAQEQADRQKEQELVGKRYGLMADSIRSSVPILQSNFNTFKTNTQADVADVERQGEAQKEQARDYYGEANRTAAQARGETQAQARQKFAAQGAVDSRGAGSYQQANENIDSDFNRYIQKNAKEMVMKLTDIDSAVGQYRRQASTLIQTEEAKLQESLRQIEFTLADNEIAKEQATREVYKRYQDRINGIRDTLAGIEQQAIEQKNNIELELQKLDTTKFTPEFMATGVPTNQAEYEFMVTNADKFKELGLAGSQANQNQGKALTMVNNLLSGDTKPITGAFRSGGLPVISSWTGSATKQADYDGLKSLLALAERGQLKGSGAVSDFEAKMLEKAAMAGLNQNLPDEEFRRRLEVLRQDLMSGGAIASNAAGGQLITAPDGQQIILVD